MQITNPNCPILTLLGAQLLFCESGAASYSAAESVTNRDDTKRGNTALFVYDLRCEHVKDPLAIGKQYPLLMWKPALQECALPRWQLASGGLYSNPKSVAGVCLGGIRICTRQDHQRLENQGWLCLLPRRRSDGSRGQGYFAAEKWSQAGRRGPEAR